MESAEIRKKCCRHTDEDFSLIDFEADSAEQLTFFWSKCRCDGCRAVFLRRLFFVCGSVTDPDKAYHLDFSFRSPEMREACARILEEAGFEFHRTKRRNRFVLYVKNSSAIEDFLVIIGASGAAFELMNQKIVRDVNNMANRQVNCDTANIEKQLASAKRYTDAVAYLIEGGHLDELSDELRETARLRIENAQASLADLGEMHNPPVSKSGVRHRLDRILAAADEWREKE